ncbi:MAG: hypothetical protein PHP45_03655 [Elusimicrobiales bacterium]|nr:hypothetical protein [Elusimicrobiales bacterium]
MRNAKSAKALYLLLAVAPLLSAAAGAETFSVETRQPPSYSSINNVSVRQTPDGKSGGFAEGGVSVSSPGPAGASDKIYIGNLEMAKAAYGLPDAGKPVVTPGLYGIYKPSGDLVLATQSGDGGTITLSAGAAWVKLAPNTLLGRLCKWVPYDEKKGGLTCAAPDEHWTVLGMGTGDETGTGSYIRFSTTTYAPAALCCRFATDKSFEISAPPPCQVPQDDFRTTMCPDGAMGAVTESRTYTCPGPVVGPWGQVSNTCPPPCKPYSQTRKIPCPDVVVPASCSPFAPGAGCTQLSGTAWLCGATYVTCSAATTQPQTGTITQTRNYTCPGPVDNGWIDTAKNCMKPCTLPPDNTSNKDCPAGQVGSITLTQHFTCQPCGTGGASCPTPGPWVETANTCYTPCRANGATCMKHDDCCNGCCNFSANVQVCGPVQECPVCGVIACVK